MKNKDFTNPKFDINRFGKIATTLRKQHMLKQDDLSEVVKITRPAYSGIERGRYGPGINVILAIKRFYESRGEAITTDWLLGESDKPSHSTEKELLKLREENSRLKEQNEKLESRLDQMFKLLDEKG